VVALGSPAADASLGPRHVYVPLQTNEVVAIDRETGVPGWRIDIETAWPVAAGVNQVFIAAGDELHALDAATGARLWRESLADRAVVAPMQVHGNRLFVLVSPDELWAVRVDDGHRLWRYEFGGRASGASMAIDDDRVYVVREDNRVIAVDIATGRARWDLTLPGILSAPAVGEDRLFVGSTDNHLYAFAPDDGDLIWRKQVGGDVVGAAVDKDVVYVSSLGNMIWALDRKSGNPDWWFVSDRRPMSAPLAVNGVALHTGLNKDLVAVSGKTGMVLGAYAATDAIKGAPLVTPVLAPFKLALWVLTEDGQLTGLRPVSMMFKERSIEPLSTLPGRSVTRERPPAALNPTPGR
jgi:outer membrane protein assembly factor BamB